MKTDNSTKKKDSVKKERREKKEKLTIEKRILQLSFFGSVLFIVAEGVMAWFTHSHSLWTDCLFDAADLVMIGPFLVLVPLLYKPVTEKHPYGYAQVESLFLLVKYRVLLALTCNLMVDMKLMPAVLLYLNCLYVLDVQACICCLVITVKSMSLRRSKLSFICGSLML